MIFLVALVRLFLFDFRLVMPDRAADRRSDESVMAGDVADHASGNRAGEAARRLRARRKGQAET